MMMKAVLNSPLYPEYGSVTIPFPIPCEEYDHTIELLERLGIGDVLRQDCHVVELESQYPVLERLAGAEVNVDELDYLAKRLDSFDDGEAEQFLAMAHVLNIASIKNFINLTFCCQQATVISDFSKLERAGRDHALNLKGGTMPMGDLKALDGYEIAMRLIGTGTGVVTPYGVAYQNDMELEQLYDGRYLPSYLYGPSVVALEAGKGYFCLPMSDKQLQRTQLRAGIEDPEMLLITAIDHLSERMADVMHLDHLTVGDLPGLNRLCFAVEPMKNADMEKLDAVVLMAVPQSIGEICQLAENLDQFDFVSGVHAPEEYGKYMIRESGHFEYDTNLESFYDYRAYGEQRVREEGGQFNECGYVAYHGTLTLEELMRGDPAEQYRQDQQMGGLA